MEKIEPLADHLRIRHFAVGRPVAFRGRPYTVRRHTTLASGEPAVVLADDREQFIVGAAQFLAGVEAADGRENLSGEKK